MQTYINFTRKKQDRIRLWKKILYLGPSHCMGKNSIFLILLTGMALAATGQKNASELIAAGAVVVQPSGTNGVLKKLPFKSLVVVDRRFDTSKAGYIKKGGSYKKLVTEQPFSQAMQAYLQQQYRTAFDSASPYTLVLVLKHLWLQEMSSAEQEHHKIRISSDANTLFSSNTSACEAYAVTGDTFIPLFKRDSTFTQKSSLKHCAGTLLVKPFEEGLLSVAGITVSKLNGAKRKLMRADVEAYNNQRLQQPRFATHVVEKGIYKTFQDFLANRLTKAEFTIEYGPHTDEVFVTEGGGPVLLTDFWGVCDGTKTYIRIGYSIFELVRQNNTYDIWGSKLSVHKYYRYSPSNPTSVGDALLGSSLLNKNKVVTEKKPLQLNMETGAVY